MLLIDQENKFEQKDKEISEIKQLQYEADKKAQAF